MLQGVPSNKRYLVTSHDAFNYFARAYLKDPEEKEWHDRFQAPEGLAPESQLSVADIIAIIHHMKKYQIKVLFPESNVSRDSIRKIVDAGNENGMELKIATTPLYGDAMGKKGDDGDTYIKMILHNGKTISLYLGESP
jgi:manganese/zinc/iron transport system substrate-binding protein